MDKSYTQFCKELSELLAKYEAKITITAEYDSETSYVDSASVDSPIFGHRQLVRANALYWDDLEITPDNIGSKG